MSIISGCINIALDALFIVGFGWGLTGAAVATALALGIGGIFPLWYFSSGRNTTHLQFVPFTRIDWKAIGRTCTNGMSEYVGNIALNIVSIGYNLCVSQVIAFNFGAGDRSELRSLLKKSLLLIGIGGVIMTGVAEASCSAASTCSVQHGSQLSTTGSFPPLQHLPGRWSSSSEQYSSFQDLSA